MIKKKMVFLPVIFMLFILPMDLFSQQMTRTQRQNMYVNFLRSEGFQPIVNADGFVDFMYEGGNYFIWVEDNDTGYFYMEYPSFYRLETRSERINAAAAAPTINRSIRIVKVWLTSDDSNVSISTELYVPNPSDFSLFFYKLLNLMVTARNDFMDEMN